MRHGRASILPCAILSPDTHFDRRGNPLLSLPSLSCIPLLRNHLLVIIVKGPLSQSYPSRDRVSLSHPPLLCCQPSSLSAVWHALPSHHLSKPPIVQCRINCRKLIHRILFLHHSPANIVVRITARIVAYDYIYHCLRIILPKTTLPARPKTTEQSGFTAILPALLDAAENPHPVAHSSRLSRIHASHAS
jgi:hypothetical protein